MRVLFAASPAIAIPSLKAICADKNVTLAGILTNPDTAKGRKSALEPTEIAAAAANLPVKNIPILKFDKLDKEAQQQVAELKPDILVSFAYGKIFDPQFLGLFPLGGINVHPSLLPKYRGPTPIQAAILNRDGETGISIQKLAQKTDSGDILLQERLQLTGTETSGALGEVMAQKAAALLPPLLKNIANRTAESFPQNHSEASYCTLFTSEQGRINWNKSAMEIDAQIRAFDPWPLCWTLHNERKLFILKASCHNGSGTTLPGACDQAGLVLGIDKKMGILIQTGDGILAVTQLQYQAKKALEWQAFHNGARNFTGALLE